MYVCNRQYLKNTNEDHPDVTDTTDDLFITENSAAF